MHHPSLREESERTRRMMREVTSRCSRLSGSKERRQCNLWQRWWIHSKRTQKLTLCEILSVELATTRPLRYSEVPIYFSRDDQWTSFSEPGKFPLIIDPIVAGSQLTRVLIVGVFTISLPRDTLR
jgi:hypothetical protein